MTLEQQRKSFDDFVYKMHTVMLKKGDDYSNEDRLSNFKLAGNICGIKPELNCLNLIATKVARLGVLLNSQSSPQNESIQDSLLDLANYTILLSMLLEDTRSMTVNLECNSGLNIFPDKLREIKMTKIKEEDLHPLGEQPDPNQLYGNKSMPF